jgi:hypothetical protein
MARHAPLIAAGFATSRDSRYLFSVAAEDDIPRLPRGRGVRLSRPDLIKIAMTAAMLVALIVLQKPCADSVAKLVTSFDNGSAAMPKPTNLDMPGSGAEGSGYVHLTPDMTPEQVQQAIERARQSSSSEADRDDEHAESRPLPPR